MKKNIFVLMLIATLVMAAPAAAKMKEPVGARIDVLFGTPTTFSAGEPFHISHGFWHDPREVSAGRFDFELEVDGVFRDEDFVERRSDPSMDPDLILWRLWVHNFPQGMTGTHTFTGHWYAPCRYAVDYYGYPGPCPTPNAKVEILTASLAVMFVSP
jgi:hypothetical protein